MSKNGRYEDGNYVVWYKDDLFQREDGNAPVFHSRQK